MLQAVIAEKTDCEADIIGNFTGIKTTRSDMAYVAFLAASLNRTDSTFT